MLSSLYKMVENLPRVSSPLNEICLSVEGLNHNNYQAPVGRTVKL